jgi:hypothetical protein
MKTSDSRTLDDLFVMKLVEIFEISSMLNVAMKNN